MSYEEWRNQRPKDPIWPLVLGFCIAVPLVAWFAYGIALGSKTGEIGTPIKAMLFITICIPLAIMALWLFLEPIVRTLRAWLKIFRGHGREKSPGWTNPAVDKHLDESFDPDDPLGQKDKIPPREFSVGPGLSLFRRFRRETPKPRRRI